MDLTTLVLAQAKTVKDPGERPKGPLESPIFFLILGFVFVYFFLIRPQRREQTEKETLLESLKKNDRVLTMGGMYGTIVNIKDQEVTLRVDDQAKVKMRFLKTAIVRVISPDSESGDEAKKS